MRQNLTITDSCSLVDENKGIHIPFVNSGRTPLKLKQGKRLARFITVDDDQIIYLNSRGDRLGNAKEVTEKISELSREVSNLRLCSAHRHLSKENRTVQTTSIPECIACCYFGVDEPNLVANVGTIGNALLPHYDKAEATGTREERLSKILSNLNWNHLSDA